jgi:hypothetical protein
MTIVERTAEFLQAHISRRGFLNRAAMVATAVAAGGAADLALKPGTAYGYICGCANTNCACGATCCNGYTEFCCTVNGGYNYCPENTVMGGWWKADNSSFCHGGARYYMDCNARCHCTSGCGGGWPFCDTGCDGVACHCAHDNCNNYMESCLQFRYGQCNQDVGCIGRIVCRVVACVPPWTIDPSCSRVVAVDDATAEQTRPCWTPARPEPPPPKTPPCDSSTTRCEVVGVDTSGVTGGYRIVTAFGRVFSFGSATSHGDLAGRHLAAPIVELVGTTTGNGYWLAMADGVVHPFGDAADHGSLPAGPAKPIVGMVATPDGRGYRLVGADGGVYCFGQANFAGSLGGHHLSTPVVGVAGTPTGKGYWLVTAAGAVYAFGDAPFHGSASSQRLSKPIVGMAATPDGRGYWLVASDGGIFSYGTAHFHGSTGGLRLYRPVVAMAATHGGGGYWLAASDGGLFSFDAPYYGNPNT